MGNVSQKNKLTTSTNTTRSSSSSIAAPNIIFEKVTTINASDFSVTLNCDSISLVALKKFDVPGYPARTISFIIIDRDIYLLLDGNNIYGFPVSQNIIYSVNLIKTPNRYYDYTRDLSMNVMMQFISISDLREYREPNGSVCFIFKKAMAQTLTPSPVQPTTSQLPTTSQDWIERSLQARSSQSSSLATARPIDNQPSFVNRPTVTSQQRSSQSSRSSSTLGTAREPRRIQMQRRETVTLKFEEIQRSVDSSFASGKFRLTVSNISNLVQERTPLFEFNNKRMGFTVTKNMRDNANEKFRVLMYHRELKGASLTMECKLISFNSKEPIVKKFNHMNIKNDYTFLDLISWDQLFISPNIVVAKNSCVIEVEIKISKNSVAAAQIGRQNRNSSRQQRPAIQPSAPPNAPPSGMECPICMEEMASKSKSSTACGHIFCTECITRSFISNPACPLCKKTVSAGSLRPIYLP